MAKRRATVQLTREDLDREDANDEHEEETEVANYGRFNPASPEVIGSRVIRKARRSGVGETDSPGPGNAGSNPFASILGLVRKNGSETIPVAGEEKRPLVKLSSTTGSSRFVISGERKKVEEDERDPLYYSKLGNLNKSFLRWVTSFMDKGAHYLFTPVCRDYIKFADALEVEFPSKISKNSVLESIHDMKTTAPGLAAISEQVPVEQSTSQNPPLFTFGVKPSSIETPKESTFLPSSGFFNVPSFAAGNQTSRTVALGTTTTIDQKQEAVAVDEEDEDSVPQEPQRLLSDEENSLYSQRVKLYCKKNEAWAGRGVGRLHVKSVEDGGYQLIIRGETSLGTVFLNIRLNEKVLLSRAAKGTGLLMVIPSSCSEVQEGRQTCTYLLRVKAVPELDQLMAALQKYTSGNSSSS